MKNSPLTSATLSLPSWVSYWKERRFSGRIFPTVKERMELVVALSGENVERKTGGPFAAAVFRRDTGALISIGVNRVIPEYCSCAHAEIMALTLAQKRLGRHDLGADSTVAHEIVISAQPCMMCLGAIIWSGVTSVAVAARGSDVETITGFDEGPLPRRWVDELERRGIAVIRNVLRKEACAVLRSYSDAGNPIYNSQANRLRRRETTDSPSC